MIALADSVRPARAFAPQMSIGTAYRDCAMLRGAGETIERDSCAAAAAPAEVLALAARASSAVQRRLDPDAMHAAALVDLQWGDHAGNALSRSIAYLEILSRRDSSDAATLTDLSAAYFVRGVTRQSPRGLFEAADAAARALRADSTFAPARFNLALALDRLGMRDEAVRAWNSYSAAAPDNGWSTEARRRATAAAEELPPPPARGDPLADFAAYAASSPGDARELGWNTLLGEWARAVLDGRPAAAPLDRASAIGDALATAGGDASLADAVRAIAGAAGNPVRLRALASAHDAYSTGQAQYLALQYDSARVAFTEARGPAVRVSPVMQWAGLFRANTLVLTGKRDEGATLLRAIAAQTSARYPAITARALWSLGTTELRLNHLAASLDAIRTAQPMFARLGERENLGAVQEIEAEELMLLGDEPAAFAAIQRALRTLRPFPKSRWRHNAVYFAGRLATSLQLDHVAEITQREGVASAQRIGNSAFVVESHLSLARVYARAGMTRKGRDELARTQPAIDAVKAVDARFAMQAERQLVEATLSVSTAPTRARAALDSALQFFGSRAQTVKQLQAYVARSEAQLAAGSTTGAERDLDSASAIYDLQRAALSTAAQRFALAQSVQRVYRRLALVKFSGGDTSGALRTLERGRTSYSSQGAPASIALRSRPGETVVNLALVGDTVLAWTVRDSTVHASRRFVNRAALLQAINRARSALELRSQVEVARGALASLYEQLFVPVRSYLGEDRAPLLIVSDDELSAIPFGALFDAGRAKYLIEEHPLRHATNLVDGVMSVGVLAPAKAPLFIGNPTVDAAVNPGLASLPFAAVEASTAARRYSNARLLVGSAADRATFTRLLRDADLVHFAGHAVLDDASPDLSALILATPKSGGSGALSAKQLAAMDLHRLRLVVLSACETVQGAATGTGGFIGLSQALAVAGVGGVVASLWRVDDAATAALMDAFHDEYGKSTDPSLSLRNAQLRMLRSPDPALRSPSAWAGFRYAGR
jgi:CHAT domain-containing protein